MCTVGALIVKFYALFPIAGATRPCHASARCSRYIVRALVNGVVHLICFDIVLWIKLLHATLYAQLRVVLDISRAAGGDVAMSGVNATRHKVLLTLFCFCC